MLRHHFESLTSKDHRVSLEDLQLVHFSLSHLDNRVVILLGVFNLELVWGLLSVQDGGREVFLSKDIESDQRY